MTQPWSPWRYLRDRHPDIAVYEADLPGGRHGCYDHRQRAIWLDSRLTEGERRSTLAHEIGHVELDRVTRGGRVKIAAESRVDAWAARHLIPACALAAALRWSPDVSAIAEELWVDERMVRARFRTLTDEEQDQMMEAVRRVGRGVGLAAVAAGAIAGAAEVWLMLVPALGAVA